MGSSTTAHAHREGAAWRVLQQWLIITGVLLFALFVAHQYRVVEALVAGDRTRMTLVIAAIFVVTWCYAGLRSAWLSREAARFDAIMLGARNGDTLTVAADGGLRVGERRMPDSAGANYLAALLHIRHTRSAEAPDALVDVLGERLSGPHELGWFIVNGLIKLGLLGTVIGFIVMLATVDSATSFDVAAVQQLLVGMSQGMRVALYTTLAGLTTSMVLSLHYLLLDRAADRLQARIVTFAQQRHLG